MFRRALLACLIASLSLTTSVALFAQTGPFEGWTELVGSQDLTRSRFGHSIALSRNTLAVGAPRSADGGAVYVFERSKNRPDRWSEVARLTSGASGAAFGWSIALDEDKLIVGAPAERTNSGSGAVYIYYRNRGGKNRWGLVRRLKSTSELFGWSVSISGDTALASAPGEVHVLERDRGGPNRWQGVQLPPSQKCVSAIENFDSDPGWTRFNNPANGNDFGFQDSNLAGGTAGEAGGFFSITSVPVWYGDESVRNLGGDDALGASGILNIVSVDMDYNNNVFIGHFDKGDFGSHHVNGIGFQVLESATQTGTSESRIFYLAGTVGGGLLFTIDGLDLTRAWSYNYDPSAGSFGSLTVSVSGPGGGTATHFLTSDERDSIGSIDTFGLAVGSTTLVGTAQAEIYVDNLSYTSHTAECTPELVAISGDTLAVGAFNGILIFDRDPSDPSGWKKIKRLGGGFDDFALEGSTLSYIRDGRVYLHERNLRGINRWGRWGFLDTSDDFEVSVLERPLAIHGNTLVAAGRFEDTDGSVKTATFVFDRNAGGKDRWNAVARLAGDVDGSDFISALALGPREVVPGFGDRFGHTARVVVEHRLPILADDFESADLSAWNQKKRKVAVVRPGLGGSEHALEVTLDGKAKKSFVRSKHPELERTFSLSFLFLANNVDLGGETVEILRLSGGRKNVELTLEQKGSKYLVSLWAGHNTGALEFIGRTKVPRRRAVKLGIEWQRATGPGHDNGIVRLFKKSRVAAEATQMDTDQLRISEVLLGLPSGSKGTGGGSYLVDLYDSNR